MSIDASQIPEPNRKLLREFGVSTGAIIAVLFGLLLPWLFEHRFPVWPWAVFGVLTAWGLLAPMTLKHVYRLWMRFGLLISKVTTPLILGIVFFLVIAPFGLVRRVLGKDSMARKLDRNLSSYRVSAADKGSESDMENPY